MMGYVSGIRGWGRWHWRVGYGSGRNGEVEMGGDTEGWAVVGAELEKLLWGGNTEAWAIQVAGQEK